MLGTQFSQFASPIGNDVYEPRWNEVFLVNPGSGVDSDGEPPSPQLYDGIVKAKQNWLFRQSWRISGDKIFKYRATRGEKVIKMSCPLPPYIQYKVPPYSAASQVHVHLPVFYICASEVESIPKVPTDPEVFTPGVRFRLQEITLMYTDD